MFGFYRLYLAVVVALYHYYDLPSVGMWAVVSFFVLSGFLMTTIMNESYGYTGAGVRRYAVNRWLRLYPSYYFVAIVSVGVFMLIPTDSNAKFLPYNAGEMLANITMIFPSFYPIEYLPRVVSPTWALTIEIFFYTLIALGISRNKTITTIWAGLSLLYVAYSGFAVGSLPGIGYGNVLQASLPFSLGAALYYYKQHLRTLFAPFGLLKIRFLVICLLAIQLGVIIGERLIGAEIWKFGFVASYINIAISCAFVVALFYQSGSDKLHRQDSIMGQFSYPVYLCHPIGAEVAMRLFGMTADHSARGLLFLLVAGGFCALLSVICVFGIDNNVEKLRQRIKRRKTTV